MATRAADQRLWDGQGLAVVQGLDRNARGDGTKKRELDGPRRRLGGKDLDRAALVVASPDVALALEVRQVLVDRRERVVIKVLGDLLEARREAVLLGVSREVV